MGKALSIFLLLLMTFNLLGFYPAFLAVRRSIRRSVREKLISTVKESDLTTFKFKTKGGKITDPNLSWEKDDEFSYKGKLYDVVKSTILDGEITLHCFEDKKETNLVALLKRKIKADVEHSTSKSSTGHILAKVLTAVYLMPSQNSHFDDTFTSASPGYFSYRPYIVYPIIDTPPPKYLV